MPPGNDGPTWSLSLDAPPIVRATAVEAQHPRSSDGVERYRLRDIWCVNLFDGHGELAVAGQTLAIRPGHVSVTPPGVDLLYRYRGAATLTWIHFAPVTAEASAPTARLPAMRDLRGEFTTYRRLAERACSARPGAGHRARAALWELLWRLADDAANPLQGDAPPTQPAVAELLRTIDRRLAEPLTVAGLAESVGLSQTHLSRLFRTATGQTVLAYIRDRRVEKARHLLAHSTLQVKAIAAAVGLPDPHFFNKTVRKVTGHPPRHFRGSG